MDSIQARREIRNYIRNGDFETGDFLHWSITGHAMSAAISHRARHTGTWGLEITGMGWACGIRHSDFIPVNGREEIIITAWFKSSISTAYNIWVSFLDGNLQEVADQARQTGMTSTIYHPRRYVLYTHPNASYVRIDIEFPALNTLVFIDNISLTFRDDLRGIEETFPILRLIQTNTGVIPAGSMEITALEAPAAVNWSVALLGASVAGVPHSTAGNHTFTLAYDESLEGEIVHVFGGSAHPLSIRHNSLGHGSGKIPNSHTAFADQIRSIMIRQGSPLRIVYFNGGNQPQVHPRLYRLYYVEHPIRA